MDIPAELALFLIAIYLYQKILTPILQFRLSDYIYLPIMSDGCRQNHICHLKQFPGQPDQLRNFCLRYPFFNNHALFALCNQVPQFPPVLLHQSLPSICPAPLCAILPLAEFTKDTEKGAAKASNTSVLSVPPCETLSVFSSHGVHKGHREGAGKASKNLRALRASVRNFSYPMPFLALSEITKDTEGCLGK